MDDIIKALECCLNGLCRRCPRYDNWRMDAWTCRYGLMKEALAAMKKHRPRRGKWEYHRTDENDMVIVKCSECGGKRYGCPKYCPNCGAIMTGKDGCDG